jgi:hypothetical protein
MNVEELKMDKDRARELWRKYQEHRAYQTPHDEEIAKIYKQIAQGRTVIRALASIAAAGMNEQGLPKLAIARADEKTIEWNCHINSGEFIPAWNCRSRTRRIRVPWQGLRYDGKSGKAVVPMIPIHLRPKRGIQNYHILWEADWKEIPKDPYLLRRFAGDAWLVVAAWDLTEVERAVMGSRLNG